MVARAGGLVRVDDLPTDTGWITPAYTPGGTAVVDELHARRYGNVVSIWAHVVADYTCPTSGNVTNDVLIQLEDTRFIPSSAPREQGLGMGGQGRVQAWAIWPEGDIRMVAVGVTSTWEGSQTLMGQNLTVAGTYIV